MRTRSSAINPVFVYGTLRDGESNRHVIEAFLTSTRQVRHHGAELHYVAPYPMAVDGEGTVVGELVTLLEIGYKSALAALDRFEGYDSVTDTGTYRRRLCQVVDAVSGEEAEAWVYLGDRSVVGQHPCVESGDWRHHDDIMGE
jgi:gamma-glutamylcyclotransferase (GGCT)/AIG2-like uncharacterized protein YtfP